MYEEITINGRIWIVDWGSRPSGLLHGPWSWDEDGFYNKYKTKCCIASSDTNIR